MYVYIIYLCLYIYIYIYRPPYRRIYICIYVYIHTHTFSIQSFYEYWILLNTSRYRSSFGDCCQTFWWSCPCGASRFHGPTDFRVSNHFWLSTSPDGMLMFDGKKVQLWDMKHNSFLKPQNGRKMLDSDSQFCFDDWEPSNRRPFFRSSRDAHDGYFCAFILESIKK